MVNKKIIIPESVRKYVSYNPDTGLFKILISINSCVKKGDYYPRYSNDKYKSLMIDGKSYLTHRLAWFLHYGEQPDIIDHINHIKDCNKISNLRSVTSAENRNNIVENIDYMKWMNKLIYKKQSAILKKIKKRNKKLLKLKGV